MASRSASPLAPAHRGRGVLRRHLPVPGPATIGSAPAILATIDRRLVRWEGVEVRGLSPHKPVMSPEEFSAFYREQLPVVYGYLLRLCAGNQAEAEDLT